MCAWVCGSLSVCFVISPPSGTQGSAARSRILIRLSACTDLAFFSFLLFCLGYASSEAFTLKVEGGVSWVLRSQEVRVVIRSYFCQGQSIIIVETMEMEGKMRLNVTYRGKPFTLDVLPDCTVGELGKQLNYLTGVVLHTMRLLVPQGRRLAAAAFLPESDQHSMLTLKNCGIFQGQVIRMMGSLLEEIKEVSQPANKRADDRILGFEEEDRRAKQRAMSGSGRGRQLPSGPYTFNQFQTLQLPGVELNPPPGQALAVMHMLASDPGIVAIMNKHRWQVGVMTELAPVGYVGISPKCLLGFNKNRGEEISLRLRTDDLRGFRKYDSIKKTLLHELAHMIHDEHDEKFHALDKQLNQEAIALDWTRSVGHTVSGARFVEENEDAPVDVGGVQSGHKLGGISPLSRDAKRAAAEAALLRMERNKLEPDPDADDMIEEAQGLSKVEPDPDEHIDQMDYEHERVPLSLSLQGYNEPDPDEGVDSMVVVIAEGRATADEPDPDEEAVQKGRTERDLDETLATAWSSEEPDPDEISETLPYDAERELCRHQATIVTRKGEPKFDERKDEPDPDEALASANVSQVLEVAEGLAHADRKQEPDLDEGLPSVNKAQEPDSDEALASVRGAQEPDPDEALVIVTRPQDLDPGEGLATFNKNKDLDHSEIGYAMDMGDVDDEVARIQVAAEAASARLRKAISTLKQQANPAETMAAIQTLFTILRNVMDHPNDVKYRRLRKGNPNFQHRVAKYEGAVEVLRVVGFADGECEQGTGGSDCLILRSSDPGLLWLAHSSLEACLA